MGQWGRIVGNAPNCLKVVVGGMCACRAVEWAVWLANPPRQNELDSRVEKDFVVVDDGMGD